MIYYLDYVSTLFILFILGAAAYLDVTKNVKTKNQYTGAEVVCGEVSNSLWLVSFPVGLGLLAARIFLFPQLLILIAVSLAFVLIVSLVLFHFGGWGGADVKASWLIGLSLPLMPAWSGWFGLPSALFVLFVSCGLAVAYGVLRKSNVPFKQRTVRFLPFMFAGIIVACLL